MTSAPPRRAAEVTLGQRLIKINLITMGVTIAFVGLVLIATEFLMYRAAMLDDLQILTRVTGSNSVAALQFRDRIAADQTLGMLKSSPDITQAVIFDADGHRFAQYHARREIATLPAPDTGDGYAFDTGRLVVWQALPYEDGKSATLVVESGLARLWSRVAWATLIVAVASVLAFTTAVLLVKRLIGVVSTPLTQLARLMAMVSNDKDFTVRATVHQRDEVGALAEGFNHMLTQIQVRESDLERELFERKQAERRLKMLAHFDTLTRLPNRNYFNDRLTVLLAKATRTGRQVALLFLDLDNFKIVNDTLGHQFGDALLKQVSTRLRKSLRAADCVCRFGGDEFTIILDDIDDAAQAGQVAEKIVAALSHPITLGENDVFVTCSIGISVFPVDGEDLATLTKNGDTAMYHAKEKGRNNFQFYSREMNARALKRLTLETGLRQALERSEFLLYYQPQIDLESGRIVGAEALLRWNHAGIGLVAPQEFIPVAEDTGLIVPIGEWVLWAACSQANLWQVAGLPPVRVSINLSARQFREPNFVRTVAHVLDETGLPAGLLELELTESALLEDAEAAIAKAIELRAMGVFLSIDDFGTGYSSMSYLKRFPINEFKIDRSFVEGIPDDQDNVALTKAIIAMAHGLNVEVVAEGVETQAQLDFLLATGCNRAQGHLIGHPVPPSQFEDRLARRTAGPGGDPFPDAPAADETTAQMEAYVDALDETAPAALPVE